MKLRAAYGPLLAAGASIALVPATVLAGGDDPGIDALINGGTQAVGAAGTLAAATLQTAGVYAQSEILSQHKEAIISLAALCYLASLASAIGSVAVFGTYRRALYFLVGPMLFYFAIGKTIQAEGTILQTGDRVIPGSIQDQIQYMRENVTSLPFNGQANVSYLYLVIDNLVSGIVQDIVEQISKPSLKEDLVRKARERMVGFMFRSSPYEPAFLKLVSSYLMGNCARLMSLQMAIRFQRLDPNRGVTPQNLTQRGRELQAEYDRLKGLERFRLDQDVAAFLMRSNHGTQLDPRVHLFTCEELWRVSWNALRTFAQQQLNVTNDTLNGLTGAPRDQVIPWQRVQQELETAIRAGQDSPNTAIDMLAAYVLKNIMGRTPHGALSTQILEHAGFNAERRTYITEDIARAESYGGFLRIVYFAGAIPYIQGVLLYLLSCAFPFFAIFLVMPGRATSFIIWISLWAWVKSWDIGFALVSVIRGVLWGYVTDSPNPHRFRIDAESPASVFAIVFTNDPLATMNTYLQVVALFTTSVPILTAHACLGATNLYDAFKLSIDQTANRFGEQMAKKKKRELAARAEREYREARHQAGMNAVRRYFGGYDSRGTFFWPLEMRDSSGNRGAGLRDRTNRLIANMGDATKSEMMATVYAAGVVEWQMSAEGRARAARLGAATGRVVSQVGGSGKTLTDAYVRALNLSFTGHEYLSGHLIASNPLFSIMNPGSSGYGASPRPGNYNLNGPPTDKPTPSGD